VRCLCDVLLIAVKYYKVRAPKRNDTKMYLYLTFKYSEVIFIYISIHSLTKVFVFLNVFHPMKNF